MRTAIIGVGSMGRRHAEAAQHLGLHLAAISDIREEALAETGDKFGIPKEGRFTTVEELLARTRPECVIVATTAPAHSPYVCLAAKAGVRFVLCEKPMAVSLQQCDEMLDVCHAHGVRLAINHQMRFMPHYQEAHRIVESEEFGGLTSGAVVGGNCGLAMNGLHYFEMFRYLTGEPPIAVTAWLSDGPIANPRGAAFEDRAGAVRLTTARGRRFYMDIGEDQGHGLKIICVGPYGQCVVDDLTGSIQLSVRQVAYRSDPTTRYGRPSLESVRNTTAFETVRSTSAVLDALLSGRSVPSGEDGRLAISTLVAAYASHERGHRPVRVDDQLPREREFRWA